MCFTCSIRRELRMTGLDAAVINAHKGLQGGYSLLESRKMFNYKPTSDIKRKFY